MGVPERQARDVAVRVVAGVGLMVAVLALVSPASGDPDERLERRLGMRLDLNRIQFHDRAVVAPLQSAWMQSRDRVFRVVHMGDSHVQIGTVTRALRDDLQREHGNAGSGLVFPYSAAKSYSPDGYSSSHRGRWQCGNSRVLPPKVPVGLIGTACATTDPRAQFEIEFTRRPPAAERFVRLIARRAERPYRLDVVSNGRVVRATVPAASAGAEPFVGVRLPSIGRTVAVRFARKQSGSVPLVIGGLSLERGRGGGAIVDAAGLGGAQFRAVLYQEHLEEELGTLEPDVVILDYGTNDYLYDDTIQPELERTIRNVIRRVRKAAPSATIVLTSAQDLYWKGNNVSSGPAFSALVSRVAAEERCGFWDWFWVAGGPGTLLRWRDEGLAREDLIHLTRRGYELKGHMLARALRDTVEWLNAHPRARSLVLERPSPPADPAGPDPE